MKTILDKYLAGETSLIEETQLKERLANNNVSDEEQWAKILFAGFAAIAAEEAPAAQENPEAHRRRIIRTPYRRRWGGYTAIAAAAMVAIVLSITLWQKPSDTIYCYVNGEPVTELAIAERQAAFISQIARSGERVAMANAETIERSAAQSRAIDKATKYLNLITN